MTHLLDLAAVPKDRHHAATTAFNQRDAETFVDCADPNTLSVVIANVQALKDCGIYELALIHGYRSHNASTVRWTTDQLEELFKSADRDKLRKLRPVPVEASSIAVYRGVSGAEPDRRVDGLAWTDSRDMACFFAAHRRGINPEIYAAIVSTDAVYCFISDDYESEYVCRPVCREKLPLTDVLLFANSREYLAEVLARMAKNADRRAFADDLPEWRHVDVGARQWAMRHFQGAPNNEWPYVGFAYRVQAGDVAEVLYISGQENALQFAKSYWATTTAQLVDVRAVEPKLIDVSFSVREQDALGNFFLVLFEELGGSDFSMNTIVERE